MSSFYIIVDDGNLSYSVIGDSFDSVSEAEKYLLDHGWINMYKYHIVKTIVTYNLSAKPELVETV